MCVSGYPGESAWQVPGGPASVGAADTRHFPVIVWAGERATFVCCGDRVSRKPLWTHKFGRLRAAGLDVRISLSTALIFSPLDTVLTQC